MNMNKTKIVGKSKSIAQWKSKEWNNKVKTKSNKKKSDPTISYLFDILDAWSNILWYPKWDKQYNQPLEDLHQIFFSWVKDNKIRKQRLDNLMENKDFLIKLLPDMKSKIEFLYKEI